MLTWQSIKISKQVIPVRNSVRGNEIYLLGEKDGVCEASVPIGSDSGCYMNPGSSPRELDIACTRILNMGLVPKAVLFAENVYYKKQRGFHNDFLYRKAAAYNARAVARCIRGTPVITRLCCYDKKGKFIKNELWAEKCNQMGLFSRIKVVLK